MPGFPYTLQKCCGVCSLKLGAILAVLYTWALGAAQIGLSANTIAILNDLTHDHQHELTALGRSLYGMMVAEITIDTFWVLSSVLVLFAVCTRLKKLVVPWLMVTIAVSVFSLVAAIYTLAVGSSLDIDIQTQVFGDFSRIVLNLYAMLCVESYRQEAEDSSQYENI